MGSGGGEITAYTEGLGLCPSRSFTLGHVRHIVGIAGPEGRQTFVLGAEADIVRDIGGSELTVLSWR